jgi:hypothetical protein
MQARSTVHDASIMTDIDELGDTVDSAGPIRFQCSANRRTAWGMLGLLIVMVPAIGFVIATGHLFVAAVATLVLPFGLRTVAGVLMHRGPRLTIDETGIHDVIWPWGLIEWADIRSVHLHLFSGDVAFCVEPRDPRRLRDGRLWPLVVADRIASWLGRGRSPAHIRLMLLDTTGEEIFEFLVDSGYLELTEIGEAGHRLLEVDFDDE